MAPVPMTERKRLELQCEWGECREICSSSQAFTTHLLSHAEEFMAETFSIEKCLVDVEENFDEYQCEWADCGHVTEEGSAALLRHLFFHGYHTRIKWQGTAERERCRMEPCQLESHSRNIIPEVPSSFRCGWDDCTFITNNPDYFYCHVEMHSQMAKAKAKGGLLACKWTDCRNKTKDKYKLRDHLRSHSQEKRFGCSQCGGLFSNRTKFFDHIHRQGVLDEPNYQCSHCSKVFASERLLRDHMRHHVNHYKCPFCDMTCPAPSVLKKHIQWRHSTERPFFCELCPHRAKTRTDMRRHMESHNADDAYQCDMEDCSYTAKSLSALRAHFRQCHSNLQSQRYMCHVCGKKFTRGSRLTVHLKDKHHFKWPSGHIRFRYKEHDDGFLRLQTVRYESIELTQQILQDQPGSPPALAAVPEEEEEEEEEDEEDGGGGRVSAFPKGAGAGGSRCRKEASQNEKSSNKEHSPYKSPSEAIQISSDLQTSDFQCLQDEHGRIVIVNCPGDAGDTGDSNKPQSEAVYEIIYVNADSGMQTDTHGEDTAGEGSGPVEARPHLVPPATLQRIRDRTVVLESGGHPLSQNVFSEVDVLCASGGGDGQCVPASSRQCQSAPYSFPIEQMQAMDESSDGESTGERSPKKARRETLTPERERVCSTSEHERMRNLFPSLEDDRMAMAVEAMTNLSRGFAGQ